MALRLSRLFGNSPEFWLNAQQAVDLWDASHTIKKEIDRIHFLDAVSRINEVPDNNRKPAS